MEEILSNVKLSYLTTDYLLSLYSSYLSPRNKIKSLLSKGDLIHIKQGLYILGEKYKRPYSKEVLSGIIYGPSAISYEYALSLHGLIPEEVETLTCICSKRNKFFDTAVGKFSYRYIAKDIYPVGIILRQTELGNYLLATAEKALLDLAYLQKFKDQASVLEYLTEDLRIEPENLSKLNPSLLMEISKLYKRRSVGLLAESIIINRDKM